MVKRAKWTNIWWFNVSCCRYPFDWRTPLGYLVAWVGQCLGIAGLMTSIPFFNIIFGSSWLFYVMTEDIINEVAAFNKTLKIANVDGDRVAVIEHFHNVIQCYADVKQWVSQHLNDSHWFHYESIKPFHIAWCRCVGGFNKMNRYPLFAFLVWNMLAISTILVLIQFQLVKYSVYNLIVKRPKITIYFFVKSVGQGFEAVWSHTFVVHNAMGNRH